MLEPRLPENRREFDRLYRCKLWTLGVVVFGVVVVSALIVVTRSSWWAGGYLVILVGAGIVFVVVDVKRTLVFKRDLREQRNSPDALH